MIVKPITISVQLLGSPLCRRYQKMRNRVLEVATQLEKDVQLEKVNDTEALSQSNPLDLSRLYINGALVASRNPPKSRSWLSICRMP